MERIKGERLYYINAFGWITENAYGNSKGTLKQTDEKRDSLFLPDKELVLKNKIANYGRFDKASQITCLTAGLALNALGLEQDGQKHRFGLIGFGHEGSVETDVRYFQDFLEFKETGGRSNLFIYTLATSALSEASIYFGLMGPLFYLGNPTHAFDEAVLTACLILDNGEADQMIVGTAENPSLFLVLGHQTARSIAPVDKMDFRLSLPLILQQLQTFQAS